MNNVDFMSENTGIAAQKVNVPKTYEFIKQKRALGIGSSIGTKRTEIIIEGDSMNVFKYTKFPLLPKCGKENLSFNIYDIQSVSMKKVIDKGMMWLLILSLLVVPLTGGISLLFTAIALFGLRDKVIMIHLKDSIFKIPDVYTYTEKVEKLVADLKTINPTIKNEIISAK